MEKNYYEILEIDKNASQEIIEKAYKVLVKKYHPDLQTSPEMKLKYESKIKEINEAYETLSDNSKKEIYDNSLKNSENDFNNLYQENINLKNELNNLKNNSYKNTTSNFKNDNYYNINRLFMITITKKEEVVLNQVEIFNPEYSEGVPIKLLKEELGFHEYDLVQILNTLSEKNLIEFNGGSIKLTISNKEINAVKSKKDVEKIELNIKEKESYNLIKELVDDKNLVSKYTLEGHLLYGDLKLSNFKMYHIILSLENKNLLKPIKKEDGEYYLLVE